MADSGSKKAKFKFVSTLTRLGATFRNEAKDLYSVAKYTVVYALHPIKYSEVRSTRV